MDCQSRFSGISLLSHSACNSSTLHTTKPLSFQPLLPSMVHQFYPLRSIPSFLSVSLLLLSTDKFYSFRSILFHEWKNPSKLLIFIHRLCKNIYRLFLLVILFILSSFFFFFWRGGVSLSEWVKFLPTEHETRIQIRLTVNNHLNDCNLNPTPFYTHIYKHHWRAVTFQSEDAVQKIDLHFLNFISFFAPFFKIYHRIFRYFFFKLNIRFLSIDI